MIFCRGATKKEKMDKNKQVLLITEANEQVASGHLFECIELARLLKEKNYQVDIAINDDACNAFKHRINQEYYEYHRSVNEDIEFFRVFLKENNYAAVVTDLREVCDEWIKKIKDFTSSIIICIDEWGDRTLSCDVIINPMIDPYFWDYKDSHAALYVGHEYLILPEKILWYHNRKRTISETINRVCISMGGVDKFGTTIKLVKWILSVKLELEVDVILGGSFMFNEELYNLIHGNDHIHIMHNISNIYDYFEHADIAFCAGGNTLHELACIGTPTIVIPTMDHEVNNGKKFEEKGFGITLEKSERTSLEDIKAAWDVLQSVKCREAMSVAGRTICEGTGGIKTVKIIDEVICNGE